MVLFHFMSVSLLLASAKGWIVEVDSYVDKCFYENVEEDTKVGLTFQVVEGGFLDIDLYIRGPNDHLIYMGSRESSGKYTFVAYEEGLYKFCFNNKMSTLTPKWVMFDILTGSATEWRAVDQESVSNQSARMQTMVSELADGLSGVRYEQDYILVRDTMHKRVSEHTNSVVVKWTFFEVLIIALGAGFEVWYIKRFFEIRRIL